MRSLLLAGVLIAGSALAAGPKAPSGEKFFPYPMKCDRLENGLTVCRVPFNSPGLVAYYTAMRVGSRNEVEAGHSGFAHFFEHMMFRGTKKVPGPEREKFISAGGFNDNAFTTSDITVYNTFGPNDRLLDLIEIEADRFQNLEYAEPAFQTEALAVLGEYHKNFSNPLRKLDEVLADTAFEKHTYKHTTMGFYEDIKKMPQYFEYSRQFFKRWYTPDNATLFVVGDFDDAQVMGAIRKHYASWQGRSAQVTIPAEPVQRSPKFEEIQWPTPTLPRHAMAWHTPATKLTDLNAATRNVLADYLVGATSPLYKELVLEKQLCESIFSFGGDRRDGSLFTIVATLKDEKHRETVDAAINRELRALVSKPLDAKRIQEIQSNTRYGFLMGLESPAEVAVQLAWYTGVLGSPDALERHFQNIARVTPRHVQDFAKEYLTARNRTIVTLSQGGAK